MQAVLSRSRSYDGREAQLRLSSVDTRWASTKWARQARSTVVVPAHLWHVSQAQGRWLGLQLSAWLSINAKKAYDRSLSEFLGFLLGNAMLEHVLLRRSMSKMVVLMMVRKGRYYLPDQPKSIQVSWTWSEAQLDHAKIFDDIRRLTRWPIVDGFLRACLFPM